MKYLFTVIELSENKLYNITTTTDDENFVSFPAVVGNPNYDAFLTQANLTDAQVQKLKTDTWYDFPKES